MTDKSSTKKEEYNYKQEIKCGYVAIVGKPNVGKSTLLNHILGEKLSITSRRPQTTRHQILGIKTLDSIQVVYVDTPGIHQQQKKAINRYMNKAAKTALHGIDVVVFVVDKMNWTDEEEFVLKEIKKFSTPVILAINKVDKIQDKSKLITYLDKISKKYDFKEIIPISAQHGHNLEILEQILCREIPVSQHIFGENEITDKSYRFLLSELVREKIMRQLGDELPYDIAVEIEEYKTEPAKNGSLSRVSALILVEKDSQKSIVIGKNGQRIKRIGQEARIDMEKLLDTKVMLNLWVKVKTGWSDDDRALKSLGYH